MGHFDRRKMSLFPLRSGGHLLSQADQPRLSRAESRASQQISNMTRLPPVFREAGGSARSVYVDVASSAYCVYRPLWLDCRYNKPLWLGFGVRQADTASTVW